MEMRVVLDTNVIISDALWKGTPHRILHLSLAAKIALYTSATLLEELANVFRCKTFATQLKRVRGTSQEVILGYATLAHFVVPEKIHPVILDDPDDDAVLACALAASANAIVSGDGHLLALGSYQNIPIMLPSDFLGRYFASLNG